MLLEILQEIMQLLVRLEKMPKILESLLKPREEDQTAVRVCVYAAPSLARLRPTRTRKRK